MTDSDFSLKMADRTEATLGLMATKHCCHSLKSLFGRFNKKKRDKDRNILSLRFSIFSENKLNDDNRQRNYH